MRNMIRLMVLAVFVSFTSVVYTQSIATVQGATTATRPLDKKIDIALSNVTLQNAIDEISARGDVHVLYVPEVVAKKSKVLLHASGITVRDAFARALKGSGLELSMEYGQLVVAEQAGVVRSQRGQGVITGKVVDAKNGKGVSGANVSVDADTRGVMSDEDGSYRLASIAVGNHTVSVRLVGYAKQTRSVIVGDGATVIADFKLEPSASVLNDVVVTGTIISTELKAVPNAITVITAKQIEERGITRIDQLFRGEIPGLFAVEQGAGTLLDDIIMYSRGTDKMVTTGLTADAITNPIKTYIDGIEMSDSKYLSQIDPKSIERIEILTGPQASTIYGANAINGVMQIFTKRGNTSRPTASLSFGEGVVQNNFSSAVTSKHQYDGNMSGLAGRFSYNLGSGWEYTGAWTAGKQNQRTSIYGSGRYQSSLLSVDVSARQGWTRNRNLYNTLQIEVEMVQNGLLTYSANNGLSSQLTRVLYGRTLGMSMNYTPLSWWSHQIVVGNDASDADRYASGVAYTSPIDTNKNSNNQTTGRKSSQAYASTLRIPLAPLAQATLTYGMDHWRNRSSSISWNTRSLNITVPNGGINFDKPGKNTGAYIQGQIGFWDALFFTYGLRVDWNPNFGDEARSRPGRYGMSYSRNFGALSAKLRGSYGKSIRPPEDGQMQGQLRIDPNYTSVYGSPIYFTLPNPDLGPEFQQGGEGGLDLYLGNRGSVSITRYNQTVGGLISSVPRVDSVRALQPGTIGVAPVCASVNDVRPDGYCYLVYPQYLNVGSIRNQGWELQSTVNLGPFTTSGTYSWAKSRVIGVTPRYRALLTSVASFTPGSTFEYAPEHTWAINTSYAGKGTSLTLNINGVGMTFRDGGSSELNLVTTSELRLRVQDAYRLGIGNLASFRSALSGYVTANINALQRISSRIDGTLQVLNLTDFYRNDTRAISPTIGRQTKLGVRYRWQ